MKKLFLLSFCVFFCVNSWAQFSKTYFLQDFSTFKTNYSSDANKYFSENPLANANKKEVDGTLGKIIFEESLTPNANYSVVELPEGGQALKLTKPATPDASGGQNRFCIIKKILPAESDASEVLQLKIRLKMENALPNGNFSDIIFINVGSAGLNSDFNTMSPEIISGFRVGMVKDGKGGANGVSNSFQVLPIMAGATILNPAKPIKDFQDITFVVNNSNKDLSYESPDGKKSKVASGKSDLYIGSNLIQDDFDNVSAAGDQAIGSVRIQAANAKPGNENNNPKKTPASYDLFINSLTVSGK